MTLKERHFETLTDEHARSVYEALEAAVAKRDGAADDAALMLINDYCFDEVLKVRAREDILQRGTITKISNYRQSFAKENPSVGQLSKLIEQQRKILGELKLTPASKKAEAVVVDDDFDAFG